MNGFVSIGGFQKIGGGHPFEEQQAAQAAAGLPVTAVMEGTREKQGVAIKYAAGKPAEECTVLPAGYAERETEEEAAELPVRPEAGYTALPAGFPTEEPAAEAMALPVEAAGEAAETETMALPAGFAAEEKKQAGHGSAEKNQGEAQAAAQQADEKARQEQIKRLESMSDDEAMMESIKRVSDDTEKVTRRNMKDCVCEHIQTKCLENAGFARLTLHPGKSMIKCFQYINRKAWEYVQDEVKANGTQRGAGNMQVYTSDIPDDLCYQWAEDYFNDPEAEEDKEKEEKSVTKPLAGTASAKSQTKKQDGKKAGKSEGKKAGEKKAAGEKTDEDKPVQEAESYGQLSLFSQISAGNSEVQKGA